MKRRGQPSDYLTHEENLVNIVDTRCAHPLKPTVTMLTLASDRLRDTIILLFLHTYKLCSCRSLLTIKLTVYLREISFYIVLLYNFYGSTPCVLTVLRGNFH